MYVVEVWRRSYDDYVSSCFLATSFWACLDPLRPLFGRYRIGYYSRNFDTVFEQVMLGKYLAHAVYRPDAPSWQVTLNKKNAFFRNLTQRTVLIPYRRFGATYRSHLQGSRISRRKSLFLHLLQRRYGIASLRYAKPHKSAEACSHAQNSFNWMRLFALCRFLLPLFDIRNFSSAPSSQTPQIDC